MFSANLGPGLSRKLAFAAQSFNTNQRMEMYSAFDDISTVVGPKDEPVNDLRDPRVPEKARTAIQALLTAIGFEIKDGMIQ